jgi:hypothetical protein
VAFNSSWNNGGMGNAHCLVQLKILTKFVENLSRDIGVVEQT